MDDAKLSAFEERLGYRFLDRGLLRAALTHRSHMNEHGKVEGNDDGQLAFLGDAVLSLAVAADLVASRDAAGKGELTKARADVVKNASLADLAATLAIPLELGEGEKRNREGEERRLADGMEAVFGALLRDAGPAHAVRVINALLKRHPA